MTQVKDHALRPYLPLLLLLFVGSGCAALMYEIVWFQLLQLAIGSSAVSLGALLGIYMGGMCLGSILLPKFVSAAQHPLKVYAKIEVGIGVLAILVLFGMPLVDSAYASIASHGMQGVFLRAVVAALCLLAPTVLMGASLPAVARWVEATPDGVSWLGYLYGGNIAGGVFGCLLAGFYLLRVHDMASATYLAVGINFAVAVVAYLWSEREPWVPAAKAEDGSEEIQASRPWLVYGATALSGLCALGAEVIWTRLLSVMLGATVYTFSIILAVFLVGLGLGSAVGSLVSRKSPRNLLGYCQILLALAIAWAAYTLSESLPYWPINPLLSTSAWFNFQIDLMRCVWVVLPAAFLWGASFPLAIAAAAESMSEDPARLVGETYAANTIGAIVGAVGFSIVLIPWIGSQNSQRLLIVLSIAAAFLVLFRKEGKRLALLAATACVTLVLVQGVEKAPWLAVAYGRRMLTATGTGAPLYQGEGMNSSIVYSRVDGGQIYFHVSGKVEASTEPYDMRLQRLLGHLPALIHPNPKSVLIVGFGAGVTAGTFVVHPEVQKITICELEKLIPPASTKYFPFENHDVFHDPRTTIHYDDARHYILTTPDKFDLITSDPIHPWVKGTATLYSKEYFELVKKHLNPGGVVTQWVPLYESDPETIKSELATFFDVFPQGTIWANNVNGEGYDVVLLGQVEPMKIDLLAMHQRLSRPDQARVRQSLMDVQFNSVENLLSTYAGRASDLRNWYRGAVINNDMNLRLQYMAGMGLNYNNAPAIAQEIAAYRSFPADMFTGPPDFLEELKSQLRLQ